MSDLRYELIRLGEANPELRPHLRPILASIDPDELFGELRSAIARDDADEIHSIIAKLYVYHRSYYNERVKPYLFRLIEGKVERLKAGDTVRISIPSRSGSMSGTKDVEVEVTQDSDDIRKNSPGLRGYYLYVKKPRGRKEGAVYEMGGEMFYQATMNTQTERIIWIKKA